MKVYSKALILFLFIIVTFSVYAMEQYTTFKEFFGIDEKSILRNKEEYTSLEKDYYLQHQLTPNHEWFEVAKETPTCLGNIHIKNKGVWLKSCARHIVATKILSEKVMNAYNIKETKFPEEYIFFTNEIGEIKTVQSEEKIDKNLQCHIIQKHIENIPNKKMNKIQAQELLTLLRFVYLDLGYDNIRVSDAVYIIDAEDKGEHFITSWQKLWVRYEFDEKAIDFLNKKRVELQEYVARCVKKVTENNEEIEYCTHLPLLRFEDEPQRKKRVNFAVFGEVLKRLFGNKEQEEKFWGLVEKEHQANDC